jgi:hypothetical protein
MVPMKVAMSETTECLDVPQRANAPRDPPRSRWPSRGHHGSGALDGAATSVDGLRALQAHRSVERQRLQDGVRVLTVA